MKKEYDFSQGERGKFYRKNAVLNLPIYLEPEIRTHFEKIALKKGKDVSVLVNDLIKKNIKIIQAFH